MNKLLTSMVAHFSPRFAPSMPAAPLTTWPVAGSGADAPRSGAWSGSNNLAGRQDRRVAQLGLVRGLR